MSTKPSAVLKVAVYEKWMNNYGSIWLGTLIKKYNRFHLLIHYFIYS
jgi:hypothetical protein